MLIPSHSNSGRRALGLVITILLLTLTIGISWLKTQDQSSERWQRVYQHLDATRLLSSSHISGDHPIKQLHEAAITKFDRLLARQSKSLSDAVKEYERRYSRSPPPGFAEWFRFAREHNSAIIDDFDMINEAMKPFWNVEPSTIRSMVKTAMSQGPLLQSLTLENGVFSHTPEDNWMGRGIESALQDVSARIPDFQILTNFLDEPRVLLSKDPPTNEVKWVDGSQMPAYNKTVSPCEHQLKGYVPNEHQIDTAGIPFVTDVKSMIDVCQHPEYKNQHGWMISPDNLFTTDSPLPILSQAAPSTFSDILYPSVWYWNHQIEDLAQIDKPWSEKRNKLYWAGRGTGGRIRPQEEGEEPFESHRFRFINITNQISPTTATYDYLARSKIGRPWNKYSSFEVLTQLYDTKLIEIVQCDGAHCEEAKQEYNIAEAEPGNTIFNNKFVMDLDGNTFSGRFYNLLASNSCVLKQFIFREWHDERLMPWLHYVPISVAMKDLPETMRYLSLTTEGSQIAQKIAQAGKIWSARLLRREDSTIYLYRLFLEYARIIDDNRDLR